VRPTPTSTPSSTPLYLLLAVSVVAIILVVVAMRRRGFLLPGAAVALLVVASILLQGAYPAAIQRLQVDPQELDREREFIARNLEQTNLAYGMDEVDLEPFSVANDLDEDDVIENDVTLRNVRLWDPDVLETTYGELQALRPYYRFFDVDIDRYEVDGELRQVMLASRELSELPPEADSWQNRHITFTHGFGIVASQVNTSNPRASRSSSRATSRRAARTSSCPTRSPASTSASSAPRCTRWCAPTPPSSTSRTRTPSSR
jgi:uncharacterized protein